MVKKIINNLLVAELKEYNFEVLVENGIDEADENGRDHHIYIDSEGKAKLQFEIFVKKLNKDEVDEYDFVVESMMGNYYQCEYKAYREVKHGNGVLHLEYETFVEEEFVEYISKIDEDGTWYNLHIDPNFKSASAEIKAIAKGYDMEKVSTTEYQRDFIQLEYTSDGYSVWRTSDEDEGEMNLIAKELNANSVKKIFDKYEEDDTWDVLWEEDGDADEFVKELVGVPSDEDNEESEEEETFIDLLSELELEENEDGDYTRDNVLVEFNDDDIIFYRADKNDDYNEVFITDEEVSAIKYLKGIDKDDSWEALYKKPKASKK